MPNIIRVLMSSIILVVVAEIAGRRPRTGALLLSIPLVSILALYHTRTRYHDLAIVSRLAKKSLILVPKTGVKP